MRLASRGAASGVMRATWRPAASGALVAALVLLAACRAAEPAGPAGVAPEYPALPPRGVPPLTGEGALGVVPPAEGGAAPVTADLGDGWTATALVRADAAARLAVRIERLPAGAWPEPLPGGAGALVLGIEVYAEREPGGMAPHAAPLSIGVRAPAGVDVASLRALRLEPDRRHAQLPAEADPAQNVLKLRVPPARGLLLALAEGAADGRAAGAGEHATGPAPEAAVAAARAPLPTRILIPRIGVDAPIGPVGLEPSGAMASPDAGHLVGWYEHGARPGEASNAVLAGHVDRDKRPAVFHRLGDLRPGDAIDVESGPSEAYRYVVESVRAYPADLAPLDAIFGPTPGPALTLITCGGAFDPVRHEYLDRVVVRAHGR